MAVSFSNRVSGQVFQGDVKADPSLKQGAAEGVRFKFKDGDVASRYVVLDGRDLGAGEKDLHLTLEAGAKASMVSKNGYLIDVAGKQLSINGKPVDFSTGTTARSARVDPGRVDPTAHQKAETPSQAIAALEARFPGINFTGDINMAHRLEIGPDVRIKPGARIELGEKIKISGNASIGPNAKIYGGDIEGGSINGRVSGGTLKNVKLGDGAIRGGVLENVRVGRHALVYGGEITDSLIEGKGTKVTGGIIEDSKVLDGARVSDGIVANMRLSQGAHVKAGVVEDFHLEGGTLSGGVHIGGKSPTWDEETKTSTRTDAFAGHARETAETTATGAAHSFNPGLYSMDYAAMMNTYNPQATGYDQQALQQHGGNVAMPQTLFGAPGLVAPNPYAGMGTGAMLGLGTGALLGMGMGGFGMGMYGLGMGGLGMMGMMGGGGLGYGLGGFNWFCW